MPTLVYSPAVEIYILTVDGRLIDVSKDITTGDCTRVTNGVSSLRFNLANAGRKYDGMFTPMDRVVCYMRRITRLLVFTGYLDVVPLFTAYPGTVHIEASCSLKRLQNWYWDPDTAASYQLLYGGANEGNLRQFTDGGLAKKTIDLLTKVTKWPKTSIHIGAVPGDWFSAVQKVADKFIADADRQDMLNQVGSQSFVQGDTTLSSGFSQDASPDGPGTGHLPYQSGRATREFTAPGQGFGHLGLTGEESNAAMRNSPYFCAMRWPYIRWENDTGKNIVGGNLNNAIAWWRNRRILVVNAANNKGVVVRAADWGPNPSAAVNSDVDLSPAAMDAIAAHPGDGEIPEVHVAFAPAGAALGPVRVNANEAAVGNAVAGETPTGSQTKGQKVVAEAQKHLGLQYVWGGTSLKTGVDCSGFVQAVFRTAVHMDLPRTSQEQVNVGWNISAADAGAGDLVFFDEGGGDYGHVGICVGNGMMIAAPHTGDVVKIEDIYGAASTHAYRRLLTDAGGTVPGLDYSGTDSGGGTDGAGVGLDATAVGEAMFNVYSWLGSTNFQGDLLTGIRALMNDQPIFDTVGMLMSSGLREFSSAPNGDFIAWFPDFFGWWGTAARMIVQDIEIERNFSVGWSDASLKTHYFVTGSSFGQGGPTPDANDASAIYQQYGTAGIASVEFPELMKAMFNVDMDEFADNGKHFLARYGARPVYEPMPNITGHRQEFFYAVFKFMLNWSQQYFAQVGLTFMPEMWPGMLMVLPTYGVQAYVKRVEHSFDFSSGNGFTTNVSAVAWSSISDKGPKRLPRGAAMPKPLSKEKVKLAPVPAVPRGINYVPGGTP